MHVLEQKGRSSLVAIGSALRLESSTLSPLVRRLEALGLVSRTRSREDERNVSIALTPAGVALSEQLAVVPDQIYVATGLSQEDHDRLLADLHRLEANLRGSASAT